MGGEQMRSEAVPSAKEKNEIQINRPPSLLSSLSLSKKTRNRLSRKPQMRGNRPKARLCACRGRLTKQMGLFSTAYDRRVCSAVIFLKLDKAAVLW